MMVTIPKRAEQITRHDLLKALPYSSHEDSIVNITFQSNPKSDATTEVTRQVGWILRERGISHQVTPTLHTYIGEPAVFIEIV